MSSESHSPRKLPELIAKQTHGDINGGLSWNAFVFKLDHLNFAIPFMAGAEILLNRNIQPIPWAKQWVAGVINIRDEVYTVVDFAMYFGFFEFSSARSSSLLMLSDSELKSALMLSGEVQLKSFSEDFKLSDDPLIPERLLTCVSCVIRDDELDWIVLDTDAVCGSSAFVNISGSSRFN